MYRYTPVATPLKAAMFMSNDVNLTGLLGEDIKEDWGSGGWKSISGVQGLRPCAVVLQFLLPGS